MPPQNDAAEADTDSGSSSPFCLQSIIRKNIWNLRPYRCARDDYQSGILLDANENALGPAIHVADPASNLHRYPDPTHRDLRRLVAEWRSLPSPDYVFLGVGSDEVIDLLIRITCTPSTDKILCTPPTYGMYSVCAEVNDIGVVKVPLDVKDGAFQVQLTEIKRTVASDPTVKLLFLCSPGNPTGTLVPGTVVKELLDFRQFRGIVVVDEAYVDFSGPGASAVDLVEAYPNLCVMQTLSKSFGLAAIRLGMALGHPSLITILSKTKAPYNVSALTATAALRALSAEGIRGMHIKVEELLRMRDELAKSLENLQKLGLGVPIGGNHANFLMVPVLRRGTTEHSDYDNDRSQKVYKRLAEDMGVVVRYRGGEYGCGGCLRITIGSKEENEVLIRCLRQALEEL